MEERKCPNFENCPIRTYLDEKVGGEAIKKIYCLRLFERCERLKRLKEGKPVPETLLPGGQYLS